MQLAHSQLFFTRIDRTDLLSSKTNSVALANVVHIEEDPNQEEIRLIVAATPSGKSTSVKMMRVYMRFQHTNEYRLWLLSLNNAIQQAKDQSWSKTNELVI